MGQGQNDSSTRKLLFQNHTKQYHRMRKLKDLTFLLDPWQN